MTFEFVSPVLIGYDFYLPFFLLLDSSKVQFHDFYSELEALHAKTFVILQNNTLKNLSQKCHSREKTTTLFICIHQCDSYPPTYGNFSVTTDLK